MRLSSYVFPKPQEASGATAIAGTSKVPAILL
jgi:hypothetical protein